MLAVHQARACISAAVGCTKLAAEKQCDDVVCDSVQQSCEKAAVGTQPCADLCWICLTCASAACDAREEKLADPNDRPDHKASMELAKNGPSFSEMMEFALMTEAETI